jgi:hypothetical protein
MDNNTLILVAAICVVVGFLIGRLASSLGEEKEADPVESSKVSMLSVWRDPETDELNVEFDHKKYRKNWNLNAEQRDQIHWIILELGNWLEPVQSSKKEAAEAMLPGEFPISQEMPESNKPRLSLNPVSMLVNALQADVPRSQLPTESIVIQIDDILQEKLKNSPLMGEPIRLMEWQDKGMVVMIGLDRYDSVEAVPDDRIKALIRSAVREWEQKTQ